MLSICGVTLAPYVHNPHPVNWLNDRRLDCHLLRERNAERSRAVHVSATRSQPLRPVASVADVMQVERELKLQFPKLLRRFYLEVADGNFGPGYGLFPLIGTASVLEETLDKRDLGPNVTSPWRNDLLCICTFGCTFSRPSIVGPRREPSVCLKNIAVCMPIPKPNHSTSGCRHGLNLC